MDSCQSFSRSLFVRPNYDLLLLTTLIFNPLLLYFSLIYHWNVHLLIFFVLTYNWKIQSMCSEKVNIPIEKPYIFLEGHGAEATIIKWGDHSETNQSATFTSSADNFVAKDISFQVKKLSGVIFIHHIYSFWKRYIRVRVCLALSLNSIFNIKIFYIFILKMI